MAQEEEEEWDQERREDSPEDLAPRLLRASVAVWQSGSVVVHWLAPVLVPPLVVARLGLALELALALGLVQALAQGSEEAS